MVESPKSERSRRMNSLGSLLEQLAKAYQFDYKLKENEVIAHWAEIAGSPLNKVTAPVRVKDGILYLKVKNDVWRNELFYQKLQIIRKIESWAKSRIITEIVFL